MRLTCVEYMVFDARAAKALEPGGAIPVDVCPGLRLLATKFGKTWTYRYKTPEGKLRQLSLGPWPAMSLHAAMAAWNEARAKKVAGVDPAAQRKAERAARRAAKKATPVGLKSYTVALLVGDYINGHLEVSRAKDGAKAARRALEGLLAAEPELAEMAANKVTRAQCFDALDARKATPMAAAKLRSMLGSAWEYALDAGRLDGNTPNWWRQVMRGKLKSKGKVMGGEHVGQSRRVLRGDEIAALIGWLGNMHQVGRDAVVLYLWTCARGSEIFAMRPEHLAKEGDVLWWTVPKEQTKNARFAEAVDLRVPLFGRARDVVERRLASVGQSGFLFGDAKGKQYTQHAFSTYVYDLQPYSPKAQRRAKPEADLPVTNWTPHNLRRTGRTLLAALGCPREVAEAVVGHLPPVIEATYNVHSYDAERVQWLQRLSDHLQALAPSVVTAEAPARP